MPYFLLYTVIAVVILFMTGQLLFEVLRSAVLRHKARKSGGTMIRCVSTVYRLSNYIVMLIFEISCYLLYLKLMPAKSFHHPLLICTSIIPVSIFFSVRIVIHIIAIFSEKYAYLTDDGLIYFIGVFRFGQERFVWEAVENADTMHIYKTGKTNPFTVVFKEQIEEAHMLVDSHQMPH